MMPDISESDRARVLQLRAQLGDVPHPGEFPVSEPAKEFRGLWEKTAFAWLALRFVWPKDPQGRQEEQAERLVPVSTLFRPEFNRFGQGYYPQRGDLLFLELREGHVLSVRWASLVFGALIWSECELTLGGFPFHRPIGFSDAATLEEVGSQTHRSGSVEIGYATTAGVAMTKIQRFHHPSSFTSSIYP